MEHVWTLLAMLLALGIMGSGAWHIALAARRTHGSVWAAASAVGLVTLAVLGGLRALVLFVGHPAPLSLF
jgi:hypothetical protein